MNPGDPIQVGFSVLTFLYHPVYNDAHPGEDQPGRCEQCAVGMRHDTKEHVLLWCCEGKNWSVSRYDPNAERHREEVQWFTPKSYGSSVGGFLISHMRKP